MDKQQKNIGNPIIRKIAADSCRYFYMQNDSELWDCTALRRYIIRIQIMVLHSSLSLRVDGQRCNTLLIKVKIGTVAQAQRVC